MTNSMTNMPRNIASVLMKNNGMVVLSEVVSRAIVMQFRRIVPIMRPLKKVVCR